MSISPTATPSPSYGQIVKKIKDRSRFGVRGKRDCKSGFRMDLCCRGNLTFLIGERGSLYILTQYNCTDSVCSETSVCSLNNGSTATYTVVSSGEWIMRCRSLLMVVINLDNTASSIVCLFPLGKSLSFPPRC